MVGIHLPKLSEYDPVRNAEGAIDPLGLYAIADRLALRLIPGIRERMSHPRFLTAMAVGNLILRDFDDDAISADGQSPPYLVYEWHAVEGIVRTRGEDPALSGLPGVLKTRECFLDNLHLCASRYLKTPTVFGFHGVYRLLADNLDIIKSDLLGDAGYELLRTWEAEQRLHGFIGENGGEGAKRRQQIQDAVKEAMSKGGIVRSNGWDGWKFFGQHLFPNEIPSKEAAVLSGLLTTPAVPSRTQVIRFLTSKEGQQAFQKTKSEKEFHQALKSKVDDDTEHLLKAIEIYETFCRLLQDAFDDCLEMMTKKGGTISPVELAKTEGCIKACKQIPTIFDEVDGRLSPYQQSLHFLESFGEFGIKTAVEEWTQLLLNHHCKTQRHKPPNGKNPWFETFDDGSVGIRPKYRRDRGGKHDGSYVQAYRTNSLLSFAADLGMLD